MQTAYFHSLRIFKSQTKQTPFSPGWSSQHQPSSVRSQLAPRAMLSSVQGFHFFSLTQKRHAFVTTLNFLL